MRALLCHARSLTVKESLIECLLHYLLSPYYITSWYCITYCLLTRLLTVAGDVDDGDADGARRNAAHPHQPPRPHPTSYTTLESSLRHTTSLTKPCNVTIQVVKVCIQRIETTMMDDGAVGRQAGRLRRFLPAACLTYGASWLPSCPSPRTCSCISMCSYVCMPRARTCLCECAAVLLRRG